MLAILLGLLVYVIQIFALKSCWNEVAPLFHLPAITAFHAWMMMVVGLCLTSRDW